MEELPIPLSRVELYLAKAAGMDVTPPEPKTRLELFLAKIAGMDVETPLPLSLKEQWLSCVYYGTTSDHPMLEGAYYIDNQKVDVRYLAVASGVPGATLPDKPQNRKEQYWAMIAIHGPIHGVLKYVTGTNITLTDVVSGIEELQFVYGDTYQQTYSGKNLYQSIGATSNGITGTLLTDGTLQITGTATSNLSNFTANASISLPAGTYTFSLTKPAPFRILMRSNLGQNHWAIEAGQTSATQTVASGITELWVWGYNITSGNSYNLNIGFQLEAGSTATSFEPYVGGIPSPNPDYPQDVQVVTGEQTVQVTGKNLFDKDNVNQYMGYFDGNADNPSLVNGTTNRNRVIYIKCKPSTAYSISLTNRDGINSPQVGTTDSLPSDGLAVTKLGNFASGSLKLENLTTSPTAQYIVIRFQTNPSSVKFDDISQALLAGLQIEQGPTATAYEPYQGQSYEINLGKNLFDKNNTTFYGGYFGGSPVSIRDVTSPPSSADRWFYIPCKPNTTYTVTKPVQTTTSLNRFRIGTVSTTPENLTPLSDYWNAGDGSTTTVHTITTGANAKYLCVFFAKGIDAADSDGQIQEVIDGLQIELGSTSTPYSPYFTPIELCKIGDYQDYIYKSGSDWYVHKEIRHLSLPIANMDNSENYPGWKNQTQLKEDLGSPTYGSLSTGTSYYTNMSVFIEKGTGGDTAVGLANNGGTLHLRRSYFGSGFSQTYWKTNYPNSIFELYYHIIVPVTDTKITDATLVGQLDALNSAVLPKPIAYITVNSAGSNLPAPIKISYYGRGA